MERLRRASSRAGEPHLTAIRRPTKSKDAVPSTREHFRSATEIRQHDGSGGITGHWMRDECDRIARRRESNVRDTSGRQIVERLADRILQDAVPFDRLD